MTGTITPREPLTLTELETLATMITQASRSMGRAVTQAGQYAWPAGALFGTAGDGGGALADMNQAFYALAMQAEDPYARLVSL